MKQRFFSMILSFILCTVFFAGCGAPEVESQPESTATYYNIETTEKEMGAPSKEDGNWQFLSAQFYRGEAVQIWCVRKDAAEDNTVDVYLYREDESTELLVSGMHEEHLGRWFLDNNGESYIISGRKITRIAADGTVLYTRTADSDIEDICQLADGSIMLLVQNDEGEIKLAELDAETGKVTEKVTAKWEKSGLLQYLSVNGEELVLLDEDGLWNVNPADGSRESLFEFAKASYRLQVGLLDFQMVDEKNVKLLYNDKVEALAIGEVAQKKQVIVLRDYDVEYWMEQFVEQFNRQSEKYFVQIEECDAGGTKAGVDFSGISEFCAQTDMQVVNGKGADIFGPNAIGNERSYIEKGLVEELKPYMDATGMKEEEYFPAAFGGRRVGDKIYGIHFRAYTAGVCINASILGEEEEPTIETLVDALLNASEKTIFVEGWKPVRVLEYLLTGSESLWGMVDWEKRTCEFDNELFTKILKVAKIRGYDGRREFPALARRIYDNSFYIFESEEELESEGLKKIQYFFDDGNHAAVTNGNMWYINSNSAVKEGAWEFFTFLLSEEVQTSFSLSFCPVNKKAFETIAQREIENGSVVYEGNRRLYRGGSMEEYYAMGEEAYRALYDLTTEEVDEMRSILEDAKARPSNTAPILNIISEEAGSYFSDMKTIEEIIPIIENRVQLYLEENQ